MGPCRITLCPRLDRTLRKCCRFLLGWPTGSPNVGVLVELRWPDALRISSGRLQSRFGRVHLLDQWSASRCCLPGCIPDPRNMGHLRTQHVSLSHFCLTRVVSCLDHFHQSPDRGLSPKSVISLTMVCTVAPQWHCVSVCCPFFLPAFSVGGGPDPTDRVLLQTTPAWGLARWGHDPCPDSAVAILAQAILVQAILAQEVRFGCCSLLCILVGLRVQNRLDCPFCNQSLAVFARSSSFMASSLFHGCMIDFDLPPSNQAGFHAHRIPWQFSVVVALALLTSLKS